LVRRRRNITVRIPVGIDEGYRLRLHGEGETPPNGGPSGDLYVLIHMAPHRYFKREDDDLLYSLIVGFPQAALGAEIAVPTLEGDYSLKIRPGTQPGEVIRVREKGMPRLRGHGRGDLLVQVDVDVPKTLTDRQKALLEDLGREFGQSTKPKRGRVFKL
jgi:molecular chaperone DnaJ